jgi:hypothetical protein
MGAVKTSDNAEAVLTVPREILGDGVMKIEFLTDELLRSPKELGLSDDERKLGFGLTKLTLTPHSAGPK